jgi:hypothetical protein
MRFKLPFLAVLLFAAAALAHGDAAWIQNHPEHSWCCGPDDCHALDPAAVTAGPRGFVVTWRGTDYTIPYAEAKPSIDGRYWLCEGWEENAQFIRCFFNPLAGV